MSGKRIRRIAAAVIGILFILNPAVYAVQSDTVTRQCLFETERGPVASVSDRDPDSFWAPSGKDRTLSVRLPEQGAGWICVEWVGRPAGSRILQFGQNGEEIPAALQISEGALIGYVPVDPEARAISIEPAAGAGISEITVWSEGELPGEIPQWDPGLKKCSVMLFAAHPGDEYTCFGGLVHYYGIGRNVPVKVVYVTDGDRTAQRNALDALWETGIRTYPSFLGFAPAEAKTEKKLLKEWGGKDALLAALVREIRASRPDVVVTHSEDGEGGDLAHTLVSLAIPYAVDLAADPSAYPDSAAQYGSWQVSKLYVRGGTGTVTFDFTAKVDDTSTALQKAAEAYRHYQRRYCDEKDADYTVYTLIRTTVGDDRFRDDLLENLSGADPSAAATPAPAETVLPTVTPALRFSPEPVPPPTQEPEVATAFGGKLLEVLKLFGIGLGLITLITLLQAVVFRHRRRK